MKVVDASLAAKWVVPESDSNVAEALLTSWKATRERLAGPHILPIELTNILRQTVRRGDISPAAAELALADFFSTDVVVHPRSKQVREAIHRTALRIANTFDLPATYDAHYLALAELLEVELWTADARLIRQLRGRVSYVRHLHEFESLSRE